MTDETEKQIIIDSLNFLTACQKDMPYTPPVTNIILLTYEGAAKAQDRIATNRTVEAVLDLLVRRYSEFCNLESSLEIQNEIEKLKL